MYFCFHHTSQLSDTVAPSPCGVVLDQLEHKRFKAASSEGIVVYTPECSCGTFTGKRISLLLLFFLVFPHSSILLLDSWGLKKVGYVCLMGNSIFLMFWYALKTTWCVGRKFFVWNVRRSLLARFCPAAQIVQPATTVWSSPFHLQQFSFHCGFSLPALDIFLFFSAEYYLYSLWELAST